MSFVSQLIDHILFQNLTKIFVSVKIVHTNTTVII